MHSAFTHVVLVPAADPHRDADDAELWVTEAKRDRPKGPFRTPIHIAVAIHEMLAVLGNGHLSSARAIELRLKDVPADVAHPARIEQPFESLSGRPIVLLPRDALALTITVSSIETPTNHRQKGA